MTFAYTASDDRIEERAIVQDLLRGTITEERAIELMKELVLKSYSEGVEDQKSGLHDKEDPEEAYRFAFFRKYGREIPQYTPDIITSLEEWEYVFVGTNPEGRHGKGFALTCCKKWGLKYGFARGICGQCVAIVTKDLQAPHKGHRSVDLEYIQSQILKQYRIIKTKPENTVWYMTKIATQLAGYSEKELAEVLDGIEAERPYNVVLPRLNRN